VGGGAGPRVGSRLLRRRKQHHHMPRHTPTRARNTIGTAMPTPIFSPSVRPEKEGLAVGVMLDEVEVVVLAV